MTIVHNSVAVPAQSKSLDTTTVTTSAGLVHRQVISVADPENDGQYWRFTGNAGNVYLTNTNIAITATALPLPSGAATAAKQPALGTAGSPSADVITVQGVSGGEPMVVQVVEPVTTRLAPSSFERLATNSTVTAKSGAGVLRRVVVNTKGSTANQLIMYDDITATGTIIGIIDTTASGGSLDYELDFKTGLTLVLVGGLAADVTVIFE